MLMTSTTLAQKQKIKFNSINTAGIVSGESGVYSIFQSTNGFQHKSWFGGIGVGIDNFANKRSTPFYIDVRKNIQKELLFINFDIGYNFPWIKEKYKIYENSKFKGGLFYELGTGYEIIFKRLPDFILSAGYSYKNLKEEHSIFYATPGPGPFDEHNAIERFDYKMRRISVKIGLVF